MVPKLRFESYFENWFSYKLSDLAVDNTLSNGVFNDPLNVGSGYKLINVVNMYKEPCIDENDLSLLNLDEKTFRKNQVFFGDLFFTRSSLVKEGIAWSNIYLGHSEDVTFDGHLIKLTPDLKKTNPKFLYFCLKTSSVRKQLIESGKTATMTTIGQSDVGKTLAFIPQLEEQTKIADFLSSVDERIILLNKQYDLLCQYKKGVMQRIFSQEVRFKDECGEKFSDWNEILLGKVGEIITGKTPSTSITEYWNGDILFTTPTDMNDSIKYLTETERKVTSKGIKRVLPEGTIMFTCIASIGKMALSKLPCITNQQINSIIVNEKYNNEFIYYHLQYIKPKIIASQANTTVPIVNKSDFSAISLQIPNLAEQTKIANFLSALDDKITVKKAELDKLKTWKQGLLQQMFV